MKIEPVVSQVYYSSHCNPYPFAEWIEIEIYDRSNYTLEQVTEWMEKYGFTKEHKVIWVSPDPKIAYRYGLSAYNWDIKIPDELLNGVLKEITHYTTDEGFIIPESDDGCRGFVFVFRR